MSSATVAEQRQAEPHGLAELYERNGLLLDALRQSGGGAIAVDDDALAEEAAAGARLEGIDFAPEGGAAIAAAKELRARSVLSPQEEVVLFNTGAGWLYRSS